MAFDGITVAAVVKELSDATNGTRIYKIAQPETDELLLTIKGNSTQFRVLLSADATLPLVYITKDNKPSPQTAPNFCMLLRKHLTNAKIISVTQPGLERVIRFELEHLDEMGDLKHKFLNVELMGKHSNIIFTDDEDNIIDSIKHISHNVSSVREVLPGRKYFIPGAEDKLDALSGDKETFISRIKNAHMSVSPAIYKTYTGFSPIMASEVCHRANVDADASTSSLDDKQIEDLANVFFLLIGDIKTGRFAPEIAYEGKAPAEFAAVKLSIYDDLEKVSYDSISELIFDYYSKKSIVVRIRQKSSDLRRIVTTALERNVKKLDLQQKQLKDTEKRDKYKVYGELINTYGYSVLEGAKSFEALNYYTNETITIPLDETISVKDNAKRYFDKYSKLKRTAENLTTIIEEVTAEIEHLRSILNSLDIAEYEEDLTQIKEELIQSGYIRFKSGGKKVKITSKPFHYVSSDGFDIYVGKNNFQNDELTFDFANGNDWWFHAKKMPGSHVVLKSGGKEVPDRAFEEAARLAAFYSAGKQSDKVEIDYTIKKNVKKPAGAKPGFVVYYTNYSMTIDTDISMLKLCKD
ncbi:MAG: NFACT family protein [Lachnospiraceae bacterium]|nr:NFACT family protein [Lachnospiraceae bacterium]